MWIGQGPAAFFQHGGEWKGSGALSVGNLYLEPRGDGDLSGFMLMADGDARPAAGREEKTNVAETTGTSSPFPVFSVPLSSKHLEENPEEVLAAIE